MCDKRNQCKHYAEGKACNNEGESRYDRYGIYCGFYCEKHWKQDSRRNWKWSPDCGETIEPEDY